MNTEDNAMATTPFTTRIDRALKARLEEIARHEDRSASYLANQAIRALVEEREATYDLVRTALDLVETGATVSGAAVDAWLDAQERKAFPEAKPRR